MKTRGGTRYGTYFMTFDIRPSPTSASTRGRNRFRSSLFRLPEEILILIMGHLAKNTSSAADLVMAMLSCKTLCHLVTCQPVLEQVGSWILHLDRKHMMSGKQMFLDRCVAAGSENAFALKLMCDEDCRQHVDIGNVPPGVREIFETLREREVQRRRPLMMRHVFGPRILVIDAFLDD